MLVVFDSSKAGLGLRKLGCSSQEERPAAPFFVLRLQSPTSFLTGMMWGILAASMLIKCGNGREMRQAGQYSRNTEATALFSTREDASVELFPGYILIVAVVVLNHIK